MPRHLKLFWVGILIYTVSFALLATGGRIPSIDEPMPGFLCAVGAVWFPLELAINRSGMFHAIRLVPYLSLLIAGWINPVFLITAFFVLAEAHQRLVALLKVAVVVMIPFTWLFFATFRAVYPREGHFLWVFGMLLALFSDRVTRNEQALVMSAKSF